LDLLGFFSFFPPPPLRPNNRQETSMGNEGTWCCDGKDLKDVLAGVMNEEEEVHPMAQPDAKQSDTINLL